MKKIKELESRITILEDKLKESKNNGSIKGKIVFYVTLPVMIFVVFTVMIFYDILVYAGLMKDWYYYNIYDKEGYDGFEVEFPKKIN